MKKIVKKLVCDVRLLLLCVGICLLFGMDMPVHAAEAVDLRPNYTLYVNRTKNIVTVMEEKADGTSVLVKAMVCSCGREGHETPEGTFKTSDYYDWRILVDGSYGRYAVRFYKSILFHSVPYEADSPDTLKWDQYNILGQPASLGCVRLADVDIKWIHDNVKVGSTVVVYSGEEVVGNAEKPKALQIPEASPNRNWDPTSVDANNPWFAGTAASVGTVEAFDYVKYADTYADLKAAFGYDREALYMHYLMHGVYEGRIAVFNPLSIRQQIVPVM